MTKSNLSDGEHCNRRIFKLDFRAKFDKLTVGLAELF